MPIKTYKPTTPARRYMSNTDFSEIDKKRPEKSLASNIKKKAGRNNTGTITVRRRGGGSKRQYRAIDFKRTRFDEKATVTSIEYDPNRTSFIMLVEYPDGTKSYILAPKELEKGATVVSSDKKIEPETGSRMPLKFVPDGSFVYNIELTPKCGGCIVRSAGGTATLMGKEGGFAQLKLPSGEIRLVKDGCAASIGQLSNVVHEKTVIGKAGRVRHMRKRPSVRGKAMNPVDHPHGGGEGRSPIGLTHPKTKWGKPALGVRTRKKNKKSGKYIVRDRRANKRK
ncbi:50S ribosomal protein L2 [Patescibacteria group bacterium]|nr:50S ribosomal protein L2 [Patescibacteria group bacterium]